MRAIILEVKVNPQKVKVEAPVSIYTDGIAEREVAIEEKAIVRSTGGGVTGQEPQEVELQDRNIGGGIHSSKDKPQEYYVTHTHTHAHTHRSSVMDI